MAVRTRKADQPASDPSKFYVAWQGFAIDLDTIPQGTRLRGDDPRVLQVPHLFVDADLPKNQWPHELDDVLRSNEEAELERRAVERKAFEQAAKTNPVRLEVDAIMVCETDFPAYVAGVPALVKRGSKATSADPVVAASPSSWRRA